MEIKFWGS